MTEEQRQRITRESMPEYLWMGYDYMLSQCRADEWVHVVRGGSELADVGRRAAKIRGITWHVADPGLIPYERASAKQIFIETESITPEELQQIVIRLITGNPTVSLCGSGLLHDGRHGEWLHNRFPGRISLISSATWLLVDEAPALPPSFRGAIMMPCFQDNWRIEQNFAWRPELVAGLDVHVFDDNFQPAESDRLAAVARTCGWHYHRSGLGEHPDYSGNRSEFSDYNRFIWDCHMSLVDDYDFVIKLDTDACLLEADWWHEAAARLCGKTAMLGTIDPRPLREVGYFWQVAWRNGLWFPAPPFPYHLQGGIYAISKQALLEFRTMGFAPGPHHDFGEDGYMSYFAQALGIKLLPAATFGSWSSLKLPPLESLRHLKAVHPMMRRQWEATQGTD